MVALPDMAGTDDTLRSYIGAFPGPESFLHGYFGPVVNVRARYQAEKHTRTHETAERRL